MGRTTRTTSHTPSLAEIPNECHDERRVKDLEESSPRPETDRKLEDRAPCFARCLEGRGQSEVARAIREGCPSSTQDYEVLCSSRGPGRGALEPELDAIASAFAPNLATVAPILSAERVASAFDRQKA